MFIDIKEGKMSNPFIWSELALYIIPAFLIGVNIKYKEMINTLFPIKIKLSVILTPFWLVNISLFSLLIFGFNLLPFIIAVSVFLISIKLYDYIKGKTVFHAKYFIESSFNDCFIIWTVFMVSLIVLRIWVILR